MENHKTDDRMEDLMQKVREGRGTDAACMLDYCMQIEEYAERAGMPGCLDFRIITRAEPTILAMRPERCLRRSARHSDIWNSPGSGNWWQPPTILWRLYPSARAICRLRSSTIWQD